MKNKDRESYVMPSEVKEFYKLKKKTVAKQSVYLNKKQVTKEYYKRLIMDDLPEVIDALVYHGNEEEVAAAKPFIYARLLHTESYHKNEEDRIPYKRDEFMKFFKKFVEESKDDIKNIELFPVIVSDICRIVAQQEAEEREENPDTKDYYDIDDIIDISMMIVKKKVKKLTSEGVSKEIAFDALSCVPSSKLLDKGTRYMRKLMQCLYAHADKEEVDFPTIVNYVVTSKKYPSFITYLLLDRKSNVVDYSDSQKELDHKINKWCFDKLNTMDEAQIYEVFKAYFRYRKRDKAAGKDSARRFFLSDVPSEDYPRVVQVLNKLKQQDPSVEEFM